MGRLPTPLIADVAASISGFYSHAQIDNVFKRNGAPGHPPEASKLAKVTIWLERADADPSVDVHALLGGVLHEFMERELLDGGWGSTVPREREGVTRALAKHGLSYGVGGSGILGGAVAAPFDELAPPERLVDSTFTWTNSKTTSTCRNPWTMCWRNPAPTGST